MGFSFTLEARSPVRPRQVTLQTVALYARFPISISIVETVFKAQALEHEPRCPASLALALEGIEAAVPQSFAIVSA